jgi:hypothetical protein
MPQLKHSGIVFRGLFAAETFALAICVDEESRYMYTDEFDISWEELPLPIRDWYTALSNRAVTLVDIMASKETKN